MDDGWTADERETFDQKLREWQQGDIGRPGSLVSVADRRTPLTGASSDLAAGYVDGDPPWIVIEHEPEAVVVLTQTCDIARSPLRPGGSQGRPWVQVAPLVRLAGTELTEAAAGRSPRFAAVPGAGADCFADLDVCTTIEKAVLVGMDRVRGCTTDAELRSFGGACARARGRFAFPDALEVALKKMRDRLRQKAGKQTAEARRISELVQIRAEAVPSWNAEEITISLYFIVEASALPAAGDDPEVIAVGRAAEIGGMKEEAAAMLLDNQACSAGERCHGWSRLVELWVGRAIEADGYLAILGFAVSEDEFTMRQMRSTQRLDLDHLSPAEDPVSEP